jgi:hypothetical protein
MKSVTKSGQAARMRCFAEAALYRVMRIAGVSTSRDDIVVVAVRAAFC